MATHECTWYNLDMLRKGFSAGTILSVDIFNDFLLKLGRFASLGQP